MNVRKSAALIILVLLTFGCRKTIEEKYPNGKIKCRYTVVKDSVKDGLYTEYYENGQKVMESEYKNGISVKMTVWNEDGTLMK